MKLQIDTENKTVKIDSNILLSGLFNALESLFPDGAWEELTLEVNSIISTNWQGQKHLKDGGTADHGTL